MGLGLFQSRASEEECRRSRYIAYFPRVFAYVQHCVGDEDATRELVTEAFARAFSQTEKVSEEDFRLALFGAARELMNLVRPRTGEQGLTAQERDLVSLLFDGLLDHGEVACLLSIGEESVTAELMRALKKLRATKGAPDAPSFLRAWGPNC